MHCIRQGSESSPNHVKWEGSDGSPGLTAGTGRLRQAGSTAERPKASKEDRCCHGREAFAPEAALTHGENPVQKGVLALCEFITFFLRENNQKCVHCRLEDKPKHCNKGN